MRREEGAVSDELDMVETQLERILVAEAQNVRGRAEMLHQFSDLRRQVSQLRCEVRTMSRPVPSNNGHDGVSGNSPVDVADRLSLLETEMGLMLECIRTLTRNVLSNGQASRYIGQMLLDRDEPAWHDLELMMVRMTEARHD